MVDTPAVVVALDRVIRLADFSWARDARARLVDRLASATTPAERDVAIAEAESALRAHGFVASRHEEMMLRRALTSVNILLPL